jgi:hypothetical protein
MSKRMLIPLFLLGAAALPAAVEAQYTLPAPRPSLIVMEPYAGVYFDNAARRSIGFDNGGALAGLRLGVAASPRTRLLADVGYSSVPRIGRVEGPPNYHVYGSRNFLASGGIEWEAVPGDISGTLGLQAGAVWRTLQREQTVGTPEHPFHEHGYSTHGVIVPSVAVRAALTSRTDLKLSLHNYVSLQEPGSQSPALSLGLSFR